MQEKIALPGFIIGGAPKSGTSSLYFWLADHPMLCPSPVKETFYWADEVNRFNKHCNVHQHDLSAYSRYFKQCAPDNIAFEATAAYLYQENARIGLRDLPAPPKMIFLLREPSAQIYSHYRMERYRTKRTDLNFRDYIKLEKNDRHVNYAHHLKKWLEIWPKEKIKVCLFEDMMANKESVTKEICRFLDVDGAFYKGYNFDHRNETVAIRSGGLHRFGLKVQRFVPHSMQRALLPIYMKFNSMGVPGKDPEEDQIRSALKSKYLYVADELHAIFPELPFELWHK